MQLIIKHFKLLALIACLLFSTGIQAATSEELMRLEADMLKYFESNNFNEFDKISNQLKEASRRAGNERLYYTAWGYQAIFEATHMNYKDAMNIVTQIKNQSHQKGSVFGEYTALHAEASVLLQKHDYDGAEKAFLKAVEFRHKHFPNESAAEDLQELMKIANHRKDGPTGVKYARMILAEPNVAPIHKGRALYRLSQMAFNKNDIEEFNRIYQEMMRLKETDGIGTLTPVVEVNHLIVNKEYEKALSLAQDLDPEMRAERMAVIYHRMGNDTKAFEYMQMYKKISDSIILVSHGNMVASCYVQMNNHRLQLEQRMLEQQNSKLRNRLYLAVGGLCLLVLLIILYKLSKNIKLLKREHGKLKYEKNDTERALEELHELSFYESKNTLSLSSQVRINDLCDRLTTSTQERCKRGVATIFQTELPDDFEIKSDADALEKLLTHLLNYAARFTHKGFVRLSCAEAGDKVRFIVSDTSAGLNHKSKEHIIGMFSEQGNKIRYVGMNFNISQSITRLLHGHIWHDSEYTNGTRFYVEIPKEPK